MPTADPILEAETIIATAIRDALTPLVGSYQGRPKAYYQQAEQGAPLPYVIYQCQSNIERRDFLSDTGATVVTVIKALASDAKTARDLLFTVAPGLDSLAYPDHTVLARYERSPAIPPSGGVFQSAHQFRVTIERIA